MKTNLLSVKWIRKLSMVIYFLHKTFIHPNSHVCVFQVHSLCSFASWKCWSRKSPWSREVPHWPTLLWWAVPMCDVVPGFHELYVLQYKHLSLCCVYIEPTLVHGFISAPASYDCPEWSLWDGPTYVPLRSNLIYLKGKDDSVIAGIFVSARLFFFFFLIQVVVSASMWLIWVTVWIFSSLSWFLESQNSWPPSF